MTFLYPEVFAIGLIVVLALRRTLFVGSRLVTALRLAVLALLLAVLAEPHLAGERDGRDLILLIDRSRSMPAEALDRAAEIAGLAASRAGDDDRIGVVSFGRDAVVETPQTSEYNFAPPAKSVDDDATDLARALDLALALIPPDRHGSILVVSDGEFTGADPATVARDALRRGVRIDAVPVRRDGVRDLAVDEIAVPGEVGEGEPFQFSAWVRCDRETEAGYRLLRDGRVIAEGTRTFRAGLNRLLFRDRVQRQGVHSYEVDVSLDGDRIPQNNRARAVVRVTGPAQVLCITPGGRTDRLTESLRATGIAVHVTAPQSAPLSLDRLDGVRTVILENVPATDLPSGSLRTLSRYVRDLGGGLLMTGGKASFGPGGYYRSEVEDVLPVSLEIRNEQRKYALAMAIALDRSGSMAAPAGGGQTKMDLANLGACAAIELLGPADHIAVLAVDSVAHITVAAQPVTDTEAILARIRSIDSGGGGIFTWTALRHAAHELTQAPQLNKHIVLFADAADAEEPGDYKTEVPKWTQAGVTISVIGLGDDTDTDAEFLEDLARLGKGRCFFAKDASELPRIFAQETIQVARSSMVETETGIAVLPDILAVGALTDHAYPTVGGYSIAYRRENAQVGLQTRDDQKAPLFAFWQHGLGRSAAFLGEVDGPLSGGLASWERYADFFATMVRWLGGSQASESLFADLRREGHEAVLSVEAEAGREAMLTELSATVVGPDGSADVALRRVDGRRLEARIPLRGSGVYRAAVRTARNTTLHVPPVTLPYSPEFERRADPRAGEKALARLTRITDGSLDPTAAELFAGERRAKGTVPLAPLCALLALLALVAEIAVRRLQIDLPRRRREPRVEPPKPAAAAPVAHPSRAPATDLGSVLDRAKSRARRD